IRTQAAPVAAERAFRFKRFYEKMRPQLEKSCGRFGFIPSIVALTNLCGALSKLHGSFRRDF
ncbi:MAG: hypothetical protein ABI378_15965, partial [Chitinophagaceae bacterium]